MAGLTTRQWAAEDGRFGNTAPVRSLQQRRDALAKGNEHRTHRKELKEDVKAGRTALVDVLLEPIPAWMQTMKVRDLLRAVPKVGPVKADKVLRRARISASKTVGGLSERQRTELVSLVSR